MSGCCTSKPEVACALPQSTAGTCPSCSTKAKSVSTLTVKSLVRDHTRVSKDSAYWFCRTPNCEVVYFSAETVFRKADVKVRVGLKEREDPIPLCYCFGYDRGDLRREIEESGTFKIPDRIKAEVQAGFCACEVKNPSGSCCLGDVNRAAKGIAAERSAMTK